VAALVCWHAAAVAVVTVAYELGCVLLCEHRGCLLGAAGVQHLVNVLLVLPAGRRLLHLRLCQYLGVSGPQGPGSDPHTNSSAPAGAGYTGAP
jgi:hypothetical protein